VNVTDKIRAKIASHNLPTDEPKTVWVGTGNGRPCDGCDFPISDLGREFDAVAGGVLRFHTDCFRVWNLERTHD
jgi:hypothetical protein